MSDFDRNEMDDGPPVPPDDMQAIAGWALIVVALIGFLVWSYFVAQTGSPCGSPC